MLQFDPIQWISRLWDWSPIIADLLAIIFVCFIYLKLWPGYKKIQYSPRPFIFVPILAVFFVVIPVCVFHYFMVFLTEIPIASDCQLSPNTIAMPSSGVLYALWLPNNPEVGNGLAKLSGPIGSAAKVTVGRNIFVFKCDVVNHGNTPIFNVEMALHLKFMEVVNGSASESSGKAPFARQWSVPMPVIGIGAEGKFSFYISNNSNYLVLATLPATVSYERSNRGIMSTKLKQPELQMSFPPSL